MIDCPTKPSAHTNRQNGVRVESRRPYVSQLFICANSTKAGPCHANARGLRHSSYNRYLAVAARAVRRSLKDDKRLIAERRGDTDLRFAKWTVSVLPEKLHAQRKQSANGNTARNRTASRATPRAWLRPTTLLWSRLPAVDRPRKDVLVEGGIRFA